MAQDQAQRAGGPGASAASGGSGGTQVSVSGAEGRVWPLVVGLVRVARLGLALAGLLVAAWLVLDGLWLLRTGEGGDTWLLVAALCGLFAALAFRPFLLLRADVGDMEPTLPAWAGIVGLSGLGYTIVGPRHGDLALLWVHPFVYPAGARYPRMVRRVIGLPGERIAIRDGHVWRNGAVLGESYCRVPFPADYRVEEFEIPPQHYLVLPDSRGAALRPDDGTLQGAGWLLGTEQMLGRVWLHRADGGGVRSVSRSSPWLEPLGLLVSPVAWVLHWCWSQLHGRPTTPVPGDDEPRRVHSVCDGCRRRIWLVPVAKTRERGLPPGFRWVTTTGLQTPRRPRGHR